MNQKVMGRYRTHLNRVALLERAEIYQRIFERPSVPSMAAVARITGEHRSQVSRVLKLLSLPEPIKRFLRERRGPEYVRFFHEKQREVVGLETEPSPTARR